MRGAIFLPDQKRSGARPLAVGERGAIRGTIFARLPYGKTFAVSAVLTFALTWAWIALAPMAFMEPEYAAWQAKLALLDQCELGDTIILGDSRAAADILPTLLSGKATNLAIGGGEPIEALSLLSRALACPAPPHHVILSFDPGHFARPDLFWERSVRYGLLSAADVAELRVVSHETGDASVYEERHKDGVPSLLRDWLNEARFPPYYFASLTHGGVFLRALRNRRVFTAVLAARGQYSFGTANGSDAVAVEGHMREFHPLPVLDRYFNMLLARLDEAGIEATFVAMPVNQATWQAEAPALREQFNAYLSAYEKRYRRFRVAGDLNPHYPNEDFGDVFCHMHPQAAERFSRALAQRLQAAPPKTQKDAQNGWFSATAPEAAASVSPSSKRGS